jgi:hypothetical protein
MTYPREYLVRPCPPGGSPLSRGWDEEPWSTPETLGLDHHMGDPPAHRPTVRARLLYDGASLLVSFRVEDRYVLATAEKHQDFVHIDSCVELFFAPGPDAGGGYFNIECNCGGTVLFHHQRSRGEDVRTIDLETIRAMDVRHSLPSRVVPEIATPTIWTVAYRVPLRDLEAFAPVMMPKPGAVWRANLYKCADRSSHPHWLTWSLVDLPQPDFHRREHFGILRFA